MLLDAFQSFGFDLPDAFARHAEFFTHFFQRVCHAIFETKPHFQNLLLAWIQVFENALDIFPQNLPPRRL